MVEEKDVLVPVRDGARMAVGIYRPGGAGQFPTLFATSCNPSPTGSAKAIAFASKLRTAIRPSPTACSSTSTARTRSARTRFTTTRSIPRSWSFPPSMLIDSIGLMKHPQLFTCNCREAILESGFERLIQDLRCCTGLPREGQEGAARSGCNGYKLEQFFPHLDTSISILNLGLRT